jgi:hypothetical protein
MPHLEPIAGGYSTIVSNTSSLPKVWRHASLYKDPYGINSMKQGIIKLSSDANLRSHLVSLGENKLRNFPGKNRVINYQKL